MRYYDKRLNLLPSTRYIVSVQAVTYTNKFSKEAFKEFETPSSITFNGHLECAVNDPFVSLNVPSVLNDTRNSMMHIVVRGHPRDAKSCQTFSRVPEDLQKYVGVDRADYVAWQAAELSVHVQFITIYDFSSTAREKPKGRAI